jgi:hypothetical protein
MNMPGFSAEASLTNTGGHYATTSYSALARSGPVIAQQLTDEQCSNRFSSCYLGCRHMVGDREQLRCMTDCYRELCGCIGSLDPAVLSDNPWCRCCPGGNPFP